MMQLRHSTSDSLARAPAIAAIDVIDQAKKILSCEISDEVLEGQLGSNKRPTTLSFTAPL